MIPQRDLASIRQRLAGSAPAPWVVERDASGARIRTAATGAPKELVIWRDFEPAPEADVEFIALARNLMDKLVEAADRGTDDIVSQEELDRLEAAARRASAGPWTPVLADEQPEGASSFIQVGGEREGPDMYVWLGEEFAPTADVELIANARQDVPKLVLELRRLKD